MPLRASASQNRSELEDSEADEEDCPGLDVIPANPQAVEAARQRDREAEAVLARASKDPANSTLTVQDGSGSETMTLARAFQIVYNLQNDQEVRHEQGQHSILDQGQDRDTAATSPQILPRGMTRAVTRSQSGATNTTTNYQETSTVDSVGATARSGAGHGTSTPESPIARITGSSANRTTAVASNASGTSVPAAIMPPTGTAAIPSSITTAPAIQAATHSAAPVHALSQAPSHTTAQAIPNNQTPPSIFAANPPFIINQPRPAGVNVPTDATHTATVWEAYPGTVDWTNLVSVTKLNRWRNQKIRRRTNRFGTKTDGRSG